MKLNSKFIQKPGSFLLIRVLLIIFPIFFIQGHVRAEEKLWQSGQNLYIKLDKQDEYSDGRVIPNEHPVNLNPQEITNALSNLYIWDKAYYSSSLKGALKDDKVETVFSTGQARLLGTFIAAGLSKARPDQDIIFVLTRRKKGFFILSDTTYTSGRAFYIDGKLNIIIGEYDKLGDKFKERAYASSGVSEVKYYFGHGRRDKQSGFDKGIVIKDGIGIYSDRGKARPDWFVIDTQRASSGYIAEQSGNSGTSENVNNEALQAEAAKLAKERREMRLEMARIRKEMKESQNSDLSVEERLIKLEELKNLGLVTGEEYEKKRKEILDEI